MSGISSTPAAPHYGSTGPVAGNDEMPGGAVAKTVGCLLVAIGMVMYATHEVQLFVPTAASASTTVAHRSAVVQVIDGGVPATHTVAGDGSSAAGSMQSMKANSGHQVAQVMLFAIFWFPAITTAALSIWSRFRAARRSYAHALAAAGENAAQGEKKESVGEPQSPVADVHDAMQKYILLDSRSREMPAGPLDEALLLAEEAEMVWMTEEARQQVSH
eukprot:GGOE01046096.1.p2 GENE.GGOE01046096.1~~GGOE01046096.1.p2  ORF type:complete len:226 (+),score=62.03 GGOE01046096.1:28-678(+)